MSIVLWARHGQNEANVSGTLSHRRYDRDLTELGRWQARELAERLAAERAGVAAIVCSPLRRARQTADVVAARLDLPAPAELEDLRELDVGTLDGRRDAAAWSEYDRVLAAWSRGDLSARFPDGEDGAELVARIRRGMLAAADRARGGTALVVAHGGNVRAALPGVAGVPEPGSDLPTGGFAVLDVGPGGMITLVEWPPTPSW